MTPTLIDYESGTPVGPDSRVRTHSVKQPEISGVVRVYAAFAPVDRNPVRVTEGVPFGMQTLQIGTTVNGEFKPAVAFGVTKDNHTGMGEFAYLLPWLNDGRFDYYGMFVRPKTPYDMKLRLDLGAGLMTAWVSGAGDDDWFMLAEDVPLISPVTSVDEIHVSQNEGAGGVSLVVQGEPWAEAESVRSHPLAKPDTMVGEGKGFTFQSMRSLWRKPGRQVTIARHNPEVQRRDRGWLGFPDVVQTGPTHLVCCYDEGIAHGGLGDYIIRHSDDLGRTWGEPIMVQHDPVGSPRLQVLKDGSLLAVFDFKDAKGDITRFSRSLDGGYTWNEIGQLHGPEAGGYCAWVPSHVAELPDGSWLVATSYVIGEPWKLTDGEFLEVYRSTDRGKTWRLNATISERPRSLSEPSMIVLPDGCVWLFAREGQEFFPGVKTWSDDGGRTWAKMQEMPFPMLGRTDVNLLRDGRIFSTCRSSVGRPSLWAWAGTLDEETHMGILGAHFNDRSTVALCDGALHIDNDGWRGQFTQYFLRGPDSPETRIELTAEVQTVASNGGAATISIPYVGRLRILPDRVVLAHDPSLSVAIEPGRLHRYDMVSEGGRFTLSIDGTQVLDTDKVDGRVTTTAWSAVKCSPYGFAFGNEPALTTKVTLDPENADAVEEDWVAAQEEASAVLRKAEVVPSGLTLGMHVIADQVTPRVTGYSIWRRVEARMIDPTYGERCQSWVGGRDGFPDQYQLDRVLDVDEAIMGGDQGYSGWTELPDGRIFVVNYTDDGAPACLNTLDWPSGLSYIRGTWLEPTDIP